MKTVKLTINGREVLSMEGATILEASRENGIHIPTLCYHPRLRPLGQCRICLVEVEGLDKPVTACDNMVQEGMAVTTDTPAIRRAREEILSLLLSTHPFEDCLTCEKSGACELQESAYTFQVEL
ncbi:MAG: 2Fe-2S iron-sulfur cluster binding domain-containing protein, partial [Firmicutes bacterium]|nr:2Fe-2S iron-sulfur cluster binding domain-containing protein [Bacillota bacterium]